MMTTRTAAPRMTHSQMRLRLNPPDDAGELLAGVAGGAVLGAAGGLAVLGAGDGGGVDGGGAAVAGALALGAGLVVAPLALCTHAAARHPVIRMAAASGTPFTRRRILVLPTCLILAESIDQRYTSGAMHDPGGSCSAAGVGGRLWTRVLGLSAGPDGRPGHEFLALRGLGLALARQLDGLVHPDDRRRDKREEEHDHPLPSAERRGVEQALERAELYGGPGDDPAEDDPAQVGEHR